MGVTALASLIDGWLASGGNRFTTVGWTVLSALATTAWVSHTLLLIYSRC